MIRTAVLLLLAASAWADLVADVRAAIARGDFAGGEKLIAEFTRTGGETPDSILALSWLGRGAQAARKWDDAQRYAERTRELCLAALKSRKLDAEPKLPLALGASVEVWAHALAGSNRRTEAVAILREELKRWFSTSIRTRIQKNIHLLSLEGKPVPALELTRYLGPKPVAVSRLKGKPVVLFFWAHWCADCKQTGPVMARLLDEYGSKGLVVMGPTQPYGYAARGREATLEEETSYIDGIRARFFSNIQGMACPVSVENFNNFGVSTTPTIVVVDRRGLVRLYHPGKMSYEDLKPVVESVVVEDPA